MNKSRIRITVFAFLALPLIGFVWQEFVGLVTGLILAVGIGLLTCLVLIRANQVGVVQNRITRGITSLQPEGLRMVFWPTEEIWTILATVPETDQGWLENVRTLEGVPLKVNWGVYYQLAPLNISPNFFNQYIPALVRHKRNILQSNADSCFRRVFGNKCVRSLCAGNRIEPVAREVRDALQQALLPLGIQIQRVWVGEILAPEDFERSLSQACGRQIDVEAQREIFQSFLKDAESILPEDRDWLINLEQLWVMKNAHTPPAVYPPLRSSIQHMYQEEESYRSSSGCRE